jgi:hypothetical protein
VQLPEREDINEWLAVNTVDFFNQINLLYGSITEFCTPKSCPVMAAGPKYEYLWADGAKIKRPIKVPHTHTHTPHPHTHARMVAWLTCVLLCGGALGTGLGARVCRLPDDMGAGHPRRRGHLPLTRRRSLSAQLPVRSVSLHHFHWNRPFG